METHNDDEDCNCRHEDCDCDLVQIWIEQNKAWHFEGDRGLDRLTSLVETLGYIGTGFKYGTPIESFLSDNPGAVEAVVEFIREISEKNSDWRQSLADAVSEPEFESMEDE